MLSNCENHRSDRKEINAIVLLISFLQCTNKYLPLLCQKKRESKQKSRTNIYRILDLKGSLFPVFINACYMSNLSALYEQNIVLIKIIVKEGNKQQLYLTVSFIIIIILLRIG